jgi:hypothetical protein
MFASTVTIVTLACFQHLITNRSIVYLDYTWRISIGLGAIPAVATIYLRHVCLNPRRSQWLR